MYIYIYPLELLPTVLSPTSIFLIRQNKQRVTRNTVTRGKYSKTRLSLMLQVSQLSSSRVPKVPQLKVIRLKTLYMSPLRKKQAHEKNKFHPMLNIAFQCFPCMPSISGGLPRLYVRRFHPLAINGRHVSKGLSLTVCRLVETSPDVTSRYISYRIDETSSSSHFF